ncbi:hypothetical protein [Azospirillum halopraeferens]|uniref:hypothetical protein n=1 Tax=Azospirillum halopraeferens TaxID=34010 RepID=UPI000429F9B2|nr:hypothetical protein [Azospirillum halopraeferens]
MKRFVAPGSGTRLILRLHAFGLAVVAAQALLVGSGILSEWPLAGTLWYAP